MKGRVRIAAAALLIVAGAFAAGGAVASHWLNTVLLDTATFTTAVRPLLNDPGVAQRSAERISRAVTEQLDIRKAAAENLPPTLQPFADKIADDFSSFVRPQIAAAVRSPAFAELTGARIQVWHLTFASAIKGPAREVQIDQSNIHVALGPYIDLLAEKTTEPLLSEALAFVPDGVREQQVAVFDARSFIDRVPLLRAVSASGPYLLWLSIGATALGLWLAPRRDYALLGLGVALVCVGTGLGIFIATESGRVVAVMRGSLGASPQAAGATVAALAAPFEGWAAQLALVGTIMVVAAATWAVVRRRIGPRKTIDLFTRPEL